MQSKYNQYGSSGGYDRDAELKLTPYASIRGVIDRAFGTATERGHSLGVTYEGVVLTDGALYADAEKQKFKVFSLKDACDMSPEQAIERGEDLQATDARDLLNKTYASTEKEYELIGAVVEEVTDDDGETLIEPSSFVREFEFTDGGGIEFGDETDLGGDPVEVGDVILWYGGTQQYGPSASARRMATLVTELGQDMVVDENDIHNFLADTSGDNVVRSDLEGREVELFVIQQTAQESGRQYNRPVLLDVKTGEEIAAKNTSGDSGN